MIAPGRRLAARGPTVWRPVAWLLLAGLGAPWPGVPAEARAGFQPPAPVVRTLANGLTVAVFHDARVPIVQVQLLLPAGAAQEPAGESGVAGLTVQMLGHGTASRTAAGFSEAVEALGGSVGGVASREFATVNGTFLAADFEAGLELLTDAVVHPLFAEDRLAMVKNQMAVALLRARQNPAALADEHLWAATFPGHPYGRSPLGTLHALRGLGVAQVRAFHRDWYRPDRSLLAVAGDVTPERAFRAAEDLLGSWGGRARALPASSLPAASSGWRVRLVDVPGAGRVELRLGAVGPAHADDDYDALAVAAELLARGPQPGLRVGVVGLREAGLFSLATSTAADSAGSVLARLRAGIAVWTAEPPAEDQLEAVRRRLAGSFPLQFETLGGTLAQWMAAAHYGIPEERLASHARRMAAFPGAAAREAAERWVPPDRLVLVAVGPAEVLRPQLEALGPVEVVPADAAFETVESPSAVLRPPTPEQLRQGRALAERAAVAHGGLSRLRGIKDSTVEGEIVMTPGPRQSAGRFVQMRKEPGQFLFAITLPLLESVQVLDGDHGWRGIGDPPVEVEDLDSLGVIGLRAGFRSDLKHLLLAATHSSSRVAWRGRERRDDREVEVLEVVEADGGRRLLFLDTESHRLVAMEQHEGGQSARRLYRDLRNVDGVLWPFSEERLLDGERAVSLTLRRVAFNTGLKDQRFRKPGLAAPGRPVTPRPR